MPRFAILYHDDPSNIARPSHCDLMFERDGVLRTWAMTRLPRDWTCLAESSTVDDRLPLAIAPTNSVEAEQLADHRLAYLDYEGPVSGDRGSVQRIELGDFTVSQEAPDEWTAVAQGGTIYGVITLRRVTESKWQLTFGPHGSAA